MTNRQGSGRKRNPDLLAPESSDLEVRELRNQVAELQRKLKTAESPDPRLLRTCESLRQDRERLEEEVKTLKRKNLELSAQTGDERRVLESNEQLRRQLAEAAAREQKLDGKYRRVAAKFKEIKGSVGNLGEKYKKLIQDKQAADQERIELMNRQIQDNEEKAQLQAEIEKQKQKIRLAESEKEALHDQLQKHKASVVKVMKHYQEAKVRKERAEERVKEICKINDTNIEQLKRCMDVLQKRNSEIEELKRQNAELQDENEGFAQKLGQLETQMSTLEERCSSTHSRIAEDKDEAVAGLQEENKELQRQIEVLKQKLSRQDEGSPSLKAKNEGLALQVRTLQATVKKFKQEMEETRVDYEERLSKEIMDKQKLEEKVRKMGRGVEVDELKKENASLRDECKDWKETCMELEATNRELQEHLETVLNEFVSSVETESDANTKKTSALQTMAREINDLKESNRDLMEMLQQTENRLKKERESHSDGDLQDKVNELTRQNAQLSKENNDLRQEVAAVKDTDYDAIVEELAELRDQNRQLLQQLEEVHEENESLQAANDVSSDQAGKSVKKLTDELNSSLEENKELRSSVKSLKRENRRLRNSLEKDHISAINESIEYVRSSLSEIGPDVASMSQAYRLEAENEELRMKLEELTNQIAEQKKITDNMIGDTEFAAMVDQLESLRSRNRELEATVDKYRQGVGETGLAAILAELEETRQKVEKLEKEKAALERSSGQNVISSDEETLDSLLAKNDEQLQHEVKALKRENELLRKQIDSSDGELATALSNLSQKKEQELQAQIAALKQEIKDMGNSGGDEQYTQLLEQQMKVIAENEKLKETCTTLQQQILELRRQSRPCTDSPEEEAKPDEDDIDQEIMEDVERMEKSSSIRVKLDDGTSEESEGIIEEESLPDDLASLDDWQDLSLGGSEEGEVVEGRRHDDYVALPQDVLDEEENEEEQDLQLNEKVKALVNAEEMWDQILASDFAGHCDQGVVASLTSVCGGNIAEMKVVEVTSTEPCEMTSAQYVLDLDDDNCFTSKPDNNAFFCIDFQHLSVTPERYMLRTIDEPAGAGHLRNWVIEVRTNEHDEWTVIDQRTDDTKLNGKSNEVVYDVTNPVQCRVIRLRMTGPNHARADGDVQHQLNCAAFEIFGSVL